MVDITVHSLDPDSRIRTQACRTSLRLRQHIRHLPPWEFPGSEPASRFLVATEGSASPIKRQLAETGCVQLNIDSTTGGLRFGIVTLTTGEQDEFTGCALTTLYRT